MTFARSALASLIVILLAGCGNDNAPPPPVDPAEWCNHVAAGPSGANSVLLDWSKANAEVRYFGGDLDAGSSDVALADALEAPDALDGGTASALATYDSELLDVCALPADDRGLPVASVELQGQVAVVHPGSGTVALPAGAKAVAVDLRDLPESTGVRQAVESAVQLALKDPVNRATRVALATVGLPDEYNASNETFIDGLEGFVAEKIPGNGATALPLAFIIGDRIAPEAAEIAITLRRAQKAWLFGNPVFTAVAEACWRGIGDHGIAYRCGEFGDTSSTAAVRWPDYAPVDHSGEALDTSLSALPGLGIPTVMPSTIPGIRPLLRGLGSPREPGTLRLGDARAALMIAHGTLRLFFPYFATTGDTIDAQLAQGMDALGTTDPPDRTFVLQQLQGLSAALADGQSNLIDYSTVISTSSIPLVLEQVGGKPVVRASGVAGIAPGDQIVAVNGDPIDSFLSTQEAFVSAATDGYRVEKAMGRMLGVPGTVTLSVQNASATTDVPATAAAAATVQALRTTAQPASGTIPGTSYYYLNLDGSRLADSTTLQTELGTARASAGLVLDMRGAPAVNPIDVAARVLNAPFQSPISRAPNWLGPYRGNPAENSFSTNPIPPTFDGKLVLLVGPRTIASAEILAMLLRDAQRPNFKVVGRQSAGTVGTGTAVTLPGDFAFTFTGSEVLHADHSTFEGQGIVPDVVAAPSVQTLSASSWPANDAEVTEAVNQLNAM
jgi:C-terminal processing protease CtpA/Prc